MVTFDSFQFDAEQNEWHFAKEEGIFRIWINPYRDILQQRCVLQAPNDLPPNYPDPEQFREYQRLMSDVIGGFAVVSAEIIDVDGMEAFEVISKTKMPENKLGNRYIGTLMFPLKNAICGFHLQCDEHGTTGMREAMWYAMEKPFKDESKKEQKPKVVNSMDEFFDGIRERPPMSHPADDAKYDNLVPDHPLSRTRRYLTSLRETMTFTDDVRSVNQFRWRSQADAKANIDNMIQDFRQILTRQHQQSDETTRSKAMAQLDAFINWIGAELAK